MMTIHRRVAFHRYVAFPLLAATATLAAAACDLFETREPETSSGSGSQWERPTSPEIIVDNLEVAFENAIFNDYRRALTEDFTFVPDDSDRFDMDTIARPGEEVYEAWDREVESSTAETIALASDSPSVALVQFDDVDVEGKRQLKYDYTLDVFSPDEVNSYVGEAWFLIRQESNGEWFIQEWQDVRSADGETSWGFLKGLSRP